MTVIGEAYIDVKGKTDNFESSTKNNVLDLAKKAAVWFAGAFVISKGVDLFKDVIAEAEEARKTLAQTEAVIKSTGGIAGITADHIDKLANRISNLTGVDDEAIASNANLLLTFTNVRNEAGKGNDVFDRATGLVLDMSKALGTDARGAAIQLGKALQDPVTGATALRRAGVSLSEQQKEQIKTMTEHGDLLGAQKLLLNELTKEFGGSAAAQATAGEKLKVTWKNMEEEVGLKLLPIVDKFAEFLAKILPPALDIVESAFGSIGKVIGTMIKGWQSWNVVMEDGGKSLGPLASLVRTLHQGLEALVAAFKDGDVTSDGFVGVMERLGVTLRNLYENVWKPFVGFLEDHAKVILIGLGIAIALLVAPVATLAAGLIYLYVKFDVVRDVIDAVGRGISAFVNGAGKELGDLVEYLQKHWAEFSEAFGHIMVVIRDIVTPILLAIRAVWNAVSDDIFNYVERVWNMIVGIIKSVMEQIRAVIQIFTALINGDWGKAWDGVKNLFKGIWDEIYAILSGVLGIISSVLGAFFSVFSTIWKNGWDGIINLLASIWDKIFGLFQTGIDWIKDHWKLLLEGLAVVLTGGLAILVAVIASHFDDIVGFFKSLPGRILDVLGDVASWLLTTGVHIIEGLLTGLGRAWVSVTEWFLRLPASILALFLEAGLWLSDVGHKILMGMLDGLVAAAVDVKQFYLDLPGRILEWAGDLSRLLWGAGGAVTKGMKDGMEEALSATVNFFRDLPGRLLSWAGDLSRLLWGAGGAITQGMKDGMEAALSATYNFFLDLPGRVLSWVGDLGHLLWGAGGALINGLGAGISAVWHGLGSFFVAIPDLVRQWVGDLTDTLKGAGGAIIHGMANGIRDAGGLLIDAILDALGPLAGVAKKVFHIGSPSRVFMDIGQQLMAGLAIGISDTTDVKRALGDLDALTPNLALNLSGVSGGGAGRLGLGTSVAISIDLSGAMITADSVSMLHDIVTEGVTDAMEAVERKVQAS